MLGRAGLSVIVKGTRSVVSLAVCFFSFRASLRVICCAQEICKKGYSLQPSFSFAPICSTDNFFETR